MYFLLLYHFLAQFKLTEKKNYKVSSYTTLHSKKYATLHAQNGYTKDIYKLYLFVSAYLNKHTYTSRFFSMMIPTTKTFFLSFSSPLSWYFFLVRLACKEICQEYLSSQSAEIITQREEGMEVWGVVYHLQPKFHHHHLIHLAPSNHQKFLFSCFLNLVCSMCRYKTQRKSYQQRMTTTTASPLWCHQEKIMNQDL